MAFLCYPNILLLNQVNLGENAGRNILMGTVLYCTFCLTYDKQIARYWCCFSSNIQQIFNGLNTDGSFTRAVSILFLSPLKKIP